MKIECWAIGKAHESYVAEGILDFTKRIGNYFPVEWKVFTVKKSSGSALPKKIREEEGSIIAAALKADDWLVSLDENGKSMNSRSFAGFLQERGNESVKRLIFLIGGAHGLDTALLQKSKFIWSLSPLTFPHQLVRLILAEQIYRACSISRNEKYHHD